MTEIEPIDSLACVLSVNHSNLLPMCYLDEYLSVFELFYWAGQSVYFD